MQLYPLCLQSSYQSYLWGGNKIVNLFKKPASNQVIAESWELSDRPEAMSFICNGVYDGKSLASLVQKFPKELVGRSCSNLPLLIKLIDANQNLSIQVHPDEQTAKKLAAQPKNEAWVVLGVEPNAFVWAGFERPIDPSICEKAIQEKQLEKFLHRIDVKEGDVIYVPAGTVHAIGKGCLIFEVQQNSNTTYRVYDYGRVDSMGKQRQLHILQALESIHFTVPPVSFQRPVSVSDNHLIKRKRLLQCPYFTIEKLRLHRSYEMKAKEGSFTYLFVCKGSGECIVNNMQVDLLFGHSYLMPAELKSWTLRPKEQLFELFVVTL